MRYRRNPHAVMSRDPLCLRDNVLLRDLLSPELQQLQQELTSQSDQYHLSNMVWMCLNISDLLNRYSQTGWVQVDVIYNHVSIRHVDLAELTDCQLLLIFGPVCGCTWYNGGTWNDYPTLLYLVVLPKEV